MYIHNETILKIIEKKEFLYIIQTSSHLPTIFECLRKRNFILLSYKENTPDTTIFLPNSTWTSGRNKLREYILNLEKKYDYYIFLDEDVIFSEFSQEDGFIKFEELLIKYNPFIANPNYGEYYSKIILPPVVEAQTTLWFDRMCNAFSREAFISDIIFPYNELFDAESWWVSQFIMIMLCSIYEKEVVLFNKLKILNGNHSEYPKMGSFDKAEQYVIRNLIDQSHMNAALTWNNKSVMEIPIKSGGELKGMGDLKSQLLTIYNNLLDHNIIKQSDLDILNKWMTYF